ncbi:MAG: ammonium transporter [Coriobacteriales bacterium]
MFDSGTTCYMIVCTAMVVLMSPGLALFYGGLSRRKNVVNTMLMSIIAMAIAGVLWVVIGDSIAYGGESAFDDAGNLTNVWALFFGGFDRMFTQWAVEEVSGSVTGAAAVSSTYPGVVSVAFQASFAMVTAAIVTGSLAERCKFGAVCFIIVLWPLLVYAPMAHMTWGGGIIGNPAAIGAIDFAGGTVVHISSGLSGLILCLILGKRKEFNRLTYRPHNVPFVMLGAGLLFFGWFGFNGGSALATDGYAGLAVINTLVAGCAATISWAIVERIRNGKVTLVGASTGLVAGLVVITPGCGFVDVWAAIIMGFLVSPVCYFSIAKLKGKLGYDDALDAFGCHGIGGILGALLVGIFARPDLSWTGVGGLIYTGSFQLLGQQFLGVLVTVVYVTIVVTVIGFLTKKIFRNSLRVDSQIESMGLDAPVHGESGYPAFGGLD